MSDKRRNEIEAFIADGRKLADAATEPPWNKSLCIFDGAVHSKGGEGEALSNAEFIAYARSAHPRALEMLEEAMLALKGISYGGMRNPDDRAKHALDRISASAEQLTAGGGA